jgi:hypothetical protein
MRNSVRIKRLSISVAVLAIMMLAGISAFAQTKPETIEAIAYGKGVKAADSKGVKVVIESYSTEEDYKVLADAFTKDGNEGLVKALKKMPSRGRISITGIEDYNITYVRVFPNATGRKIRLITDRPSTFRETQGRQSTTDYSLSAMELELNTTEDKSTGTFLPACEFKLNNEKGIEIEAYYQPWRLEHITVK